MTRSAYLRTLRGNRKVLGICIECGAKLFDGWTHVRCMECLDRQRAASLRFSRSPRGKQAMRTEYARRRERIDADGRRVYAERQRARYMRLKLAGLCVACGHAQAGDTNRCEPCRIKLNASALRWWLANRRAA